MWNNPDTIAAVATPPGRGGVGIIRLSGKRVPELAVAILGSLPSPRKAVHRLFKAVDGTALDDGIALYFPAPHSFTGEDVLELQGHGGTVVLDMLLKRCVELGARLARPGEFSERAFLNDKLDLAQAEAIADLIDSGSEQAARSALRSLQGEFSTAVNVLLTGLIELRVYVEAALDFPDEEIDFLADVAVTNRLESIKQQLHTIFLKARQGSLLRDGMHLVIVGRPNAGKSSLLNALAGQETAIVTEIAGTTRDVLRERINLDGMPLHIVDTAGLRESDDPVEKIGIERAWAEIAKADLILLLVDDTRHDEPENADILARLPPHLPRITVHNKVDLSGKLPGKQGEHLYISAKQSLGIDALRAELKTRMGYQGEAEGTFMARRRHLQALETTQAAVERAEFQLREFNAGELMAEELRTAQDALGQITGRFTPNDLLGEIFSSFCIGK
ncbi:tRNA uridine-5-carboxymethylaminomethyl(34) synthesis GTPase MnmE [Thiothrix subterranea]|uniref:tRNA modification GTPase MnmE n=1 Tax=Thiothrix subterranea TaxID=2735563 RepID=A0AA51MQX0_9GAMM|nr:tRNA uridine-5-carboxymethylaminomethyl(34) synthesis GTPase MnmE [Thiothrix subterranea]MDQ5770923.1 tRNA uridine-5-carboxymethylaminomethyl(34) synthesis GTPase MnmE [Thiothrix subterranea]WML87641.1 tRNA uridine-5-carboxymethylaminomethyl(34) synthesis GTPase MnmE [Thiothrix subterranea]